MSQTCKMCLRGPQVGVTRSHSMNQSRRRFNLNLQTRTIAGKTMQICTDCIKTSKKKARA